MKGMWTKQFTSEGRQFYYNSTLNKSVWHTPAHPAVIHEAENAGKPKESLVPSSSTRDSAVIEGKEQREEAEKEKKLVIERTEGRRMTPVVGEEAISSVSSTHHADDTR